MLARHVVPITPSLPTRLARYLLTSKTNKPTSILRTLFQVPYPVNPVFATLTKTPGVWGYSSHSGTHLSVAADSMRAMSAFQSLLLTTATGSLTARPSGCTDPIRVTATPALSPLPATLMDLPANVANKRLTAWLSLLDATLTKKRGGGAFSANTALRQGEEKPDIRKVDRSRPIRYFLSPNPFPCFFTSLPHCFYPFPMRENSKMFATVEEAVEEIRQGRMVVLVDDEDRENEGDLAMAAEKIAPEAINFMAKYGRGLICLPLTEERCDELHLPLMSPINTSVHGTAFCEAIDARPGHIFPLRARTGGVLVRAGQTEASVDLARIAGLSPAGVICEIMNEDGTMARVPQLIEFCREHNLKMLTVADLIRYRMQHERYVRRVAEAVLPTRFGDFRMIAYASDVDHDQHVALVRGELEGA